jgi:hypothetical protein
LTKENKIIYNYLGDYMYKYLFLIFYVFILFLGCKNFKKNNEIKTDYKEKVTENLDLENIDININKFKNNYLGTVLRIYVDPLSKKNGMGIWKDSVQNLNFINENINILSNVEEIYFDVWDIDKIDFSPLFNLKNLESIGIWCHDDSLIDFPNFSGIKKLNRLTIYKALINSFLNIGDNLPNIMFLHIAYKDYWDVKEITNLDCISKINNLREINLYLGGYVNINFSDLSGLINLEKFETRTRGIVDFKGCEKLSSLKILWLEECTPKNINYLGNIVTLQSLSIRFDKGIKNINFLNNLTNLESLGIVNYKYEDENFNEIKSYQTKIDILPMKKLLALKAVGFKGFIIDNIFILNELPILEYIYFDDCYILPDNNIRNILKDSISISINFKGDH